MAEYVWVGSLPKVALFSETGVMLSRHPRINHP